MEIAVNCFEMWWPNLVSLIRDLTPDYLVPNLGARS